MKGLHNESGQMLIMTAIELLLLIGFLALAVDVGVLFHTKRHMQVAVDAGATAAALHNYNASFQYTNPITTDAQAACLAIAQNGYATVADCAKAASGSTGFAGSNGVHITVYEPPNDGYHTSSSSFVEVIMSKPDPLYFYKVFSGQKTATVAARAVAGDPEGAAGCIYTGNMYLGGNATIQGSQSASSSSCTGAQKACGIYVNGTATSLDNGSVVCANFVRALSGSTTKFSTSPTVTQIVNTNPTQPYSTNYTPTPLSKDTAGIALCNGSNTYSGTTFDEASGNSLPTGLSTYDYSATQTSGTYDSTGALISTTQYTVSGGFENVVCFSQNVTIGGTGTTNYFPPGFYVFENGATLNGQVNFGQASSTTPTCSSGTANSYNGAVIYNYSGTLAMGNSGAQLTSCGPTNKTNTTGSTNQYNGVAIMQPYPTSDNLYAPSNTNVLQLVFGSSSMASNSCSLTDAALNGWIVAPGAPVYMHDQGGGIMVTGVVSASLGEPKTTGPDTDTSGNGSFNGTMGVCNYNTVNSQTTPFKVISLVE